MCLAQGPQRSDTGDNINDINIYLINCASWKMVILNGYDTFNPAALRIVIRAILSTIQ